MNFDFNAAQQILDYLILATIGTGIWILGYGLGVLVGVVIIDQYPNAVQSHRMRRQDALVSQQSALLGKCHYRTLFQFAKQHGLATRTIKKAVLVEAIAKYQVNQGLV